MQTTILERRATSKVSPLATQAFCLGDSLDTGRKGGGPGRVGPSHQAEAQTRVHHKQRSVWTHVAVLSLGR